MSKKTSTPPVVGLDYVDKRDAGGALWVIGGRELVGIMGDLQKRGAHFECREGDGKATKEKDAWWVK